MPGPLPSPNRRRRNKPTIPTRSLPAEGFAGPYPRPPAWVHLGKEGQAWWRWAWRTPQAAGWSSGNLRMIARRAELEDDLATIARVRNLDIEELAEAESERDRAELLKWTITSLAAMSSGRLAIQKEMRELEDRLGLTPKGMAALRWEVIGPKDPDPKPAESAPTPTGPRRLRAVDPAAVSA